MFQNKTLTRSTGKAEDKGSSIQLVLRRKKYIWKPLGDQSGQISVIARSW